MNKKDRLEILHEEMNSKFDQVIEYVSDIPEMKRDIKDIKERTERLEGSDLVTKQVIREHSSDIAELKAQSHSH